MIGQHAQAHVRCGCYLLHQRGGHTWIKAHRGEAPKVGCWPIEKAEQLTLGRRRPPGLARHAIATEPARLCGCCGRHSYEVELMRGDLGSGWRCPKHVGRAPCVIDCCGATVAGRPDVPWICPRHWRMAPRRMRDVERRILRLARRIGWSDAMRDRYWRVFWRIKREIDDPRMDTREIERLFGIE